MFTAARGWIEIDENHRPAVSALLSRSNRDPYSRAWAMPAGTGSWSMYLLFGADLPDRDVGWLRAQVDELAALPALDADGDRPFGLMVLTDEDGETTEWQIGAGAVRELASSSPWLTTPR